MTHLITGPDIPTKKINDQMQAMTVNHNQTRHHSANSKWASPISGILNDEELRLEREKLEKAKSLEQRRGHLSAILEADKNQFQSEISSQRRPSNGSIPMDFHIQPAEPSELADPSPDHWPEQQQEEESKQANSKRRHQELKMILQQQMEEFNRKEEESEALKRQEERLIKAQWELEQFQEQRREMKRDYRQPDQSRQLLRQHKAKLHKRSKEIQEQLEINIQFLAGIVEQSSGEEQWQTNVTNIFEQFQQQLQSEKAKERDLDGMYQEEAAKQYTRFEQEWNRDHEAREKLMRPIVADRQEQLMKQLRALKEQQRDVYEKQRTLIEDMEQARTYDRIEKQKQVPIIRAEPEKARLPDPIAYQPPVRQETSAPVTDTKFFGRRRISWN